MKSRRWQYLWMGIAAGGLAATLIGSALYPTLSDGPPNNWGKLVEKNSYRGLDKIDVEVNIHQGCRIATFGLHPWLPPGAPRTDAWARDSARALRLMGMPEEAAGRAIKALATGKPDQNVAMGDLYGVGTVSGKLFYPSFTTTYRSGGKAVVCRDSTTNFVNAHRQEYAMLYFIRDATGRMWHVGEFLACGNVSVFNAAPPGWVPPGAPGVIPPDALGGGGDGPVGPAPGASAPVRNNIPEPGSGVLVLIALVAGWLAWRK